LRPCPQARSAKSLSTFPSTPPLGLGGCVPPPGCGYPKKPTTFGAVRGDECKRWLDLQASEAELILCNGDEKMKRGMASPTPHATAPRRRCPRCGGAWQRRLLCVATATPQNRRGGARRRHPLCVTLQHLCVGSRFSQATTRVSLWRYGVGSRLSLNMKPRADRCGPGEVDRRLLPRQDRVSLGAAADRTPPPGAGAQRQHQGRAGERPPFSTLRAHPNEHPARDKRSSGWLSAADGGGWATPIQSQRIRLHAT